MIKSKYLFFNNYKEMMYWIQKVYGFFKERKIDIKFREEENSMFVRGQKLIFAVSDR